MIKNAVAAVSAFAFLSACAPLAQAPLVYSSKDQVGLSVTSTVAESPGVEINVGYKSVDTAYVPVGISQPCPQAATNCDNPISIVSSGDIGVVGGNVTDEQLADAVKSANRAEIRLKAAQAALDAARETLDKADAQKDLRRAQDDLAAAQVEQQAAQASAAGASSSEVDGEVVDPVAAAKHKVDRAQEAIASANGKLTLLQANVARAQEELARASDEKRNADLLVGFLKNALENGGSSNRQDAYSVFGSFDSTSTATATAGGATSAGGGDDRGSSPSVSGGAGLTLGKVFSTGLASQNLTDGLRRSAAAGATGDCMRSAAALIATAAAEQKEAMTKQAWELCSGQSK